VLLVQNKALIVFNLNMTDDIFMSTQNDDVLLSDDVLEDEEDDFADDSLTEDLNTLVDDEEDPDAVEEDVFDDQDDF